jgi:predicted outer membrane lipoprotein
MNICTFSVLNTVDIPCIEGIICTMWWEKVGEIRKKW